MLRALPPELARPPVPHPLPFLPNPAAVAAWLRGTRFEQELLHTAGEVRRHRFPLLGTMVETGAEIRWRRDYLNQIETDTRHFRRIPYLDAARAGDHKIIWELNRHQHLVLLAQAWLLTAREEYLEETRSQLESWFAANPFLYGINWTSALEVAFRALSWLWLYHLVGAERLPAEFLPGLYRHGCYLEANLSVYFSPNTHLLGEAVALHALGRLFGKPDWERTGAEVVRQQMERQVHDDGSHFEQSTYYHVYALDMFLFHAVLCADVPEAYRDKLGRMADYLRSLIGCGRSLPFLGDDDGGRFFHPYGARDEFGCATLASCAVFLKRPDLWNEPADLCAQAAWWLGPEALDWRGDGGEKARRSVLFADAGLAVMPAGQNLVIADAGPFGPWGAGHSHADTLALVASAGKERILIDPGTYTYVGEPQWRNWFRGTAAHNTVRIDGRDQAVPVNPFRWADRPQVRIRKWTTTAEQDFLDAECGYAGFLHRRRVLFVKPDLLLVVDDIDGPAGEHGIEQFWHVGEAVKTVDGRVFEIGTAARLVLDGKGELQEGGAHGWRSPAFGVRVPAPVIWTARRTLLPVRLAAGLILSGSGVLEISSREAVEFCVRRAGDETTYRI